MSTPRERKKGSKSDWSSWSIFLYVHLHLTFEGTIQDQLATCSLGLFYTTGFRNFSLENYCWIYCIQGGFLNSKLLYDHYQGSSGVKVDGPSKTEVDVAPSIRITIDFELMAVYLSSRPPTLDPTFDWLTDK